MMEQMFSGPIPGESLTREPGNAPWEQPPQFDKVEHVAAFYIERFEDDEHLEDLLDVLDKGMAIDHLVSSMLMYGEMEGKHTVDASMLVAPLLHEYIKFLAESADIPYVEFQGGEEEDPLIDDFEAMFSPEEPPMALEDQPVIEEISEEPPRPRGLVKRRD